MSARLPFPELTAISGLVVVIRGQDASQYPAVIDTLAEAGVASVELTLSTPKTLDVLPDLVDRYVGIVDVGVGTVTTHPQLLRAIDGGARYIVTPVTDVSLVETSMASGVPIMPGGLTPTELHASWSAGATAVKVFPASLVGPGYVKDLRGPFPDIQVVPSGGVDLTAAQDWLRAGASAVSVGGPLLGDALSGGSLPELAARSREFVAAVKECR